MIEIVVIVDNPYEAPERGTRSRLPLSKGTFCTVIMEMVEGSDWQTFYNDVKSEVENRLKSA